MSEQNTIVQQIEQYTEIAENMIEKKDFVGFVENIGIASFCAKNDEQFLSKVYMNFANTQSLWNSHHLL
jgi:hypothetical protein